MIERVKIVEADTVVELENKINRGIVGEVVKDVKFYMNPKISAGYGGSSYSSGAKYVAMIIYEQAI